MSTVRIPTRQRRWPAYAIAAVVVFAVLFTVMSQFYVDLLWFREVGYQSVFWTEIWTKLSLGLVFGLIFFAGLYVNLLIARRIAPTTRFLTPEQEVIERLRQSFDPYLRWLIPAACALLAFLVGIGVTGKWQMFLLWRNSSGVTFGDPEPLFGRDPAFYIFTLPWLQFLQGWLFSSLVGITLITGFAHFVWGGIRPQAPSWSDKVTPAARAHLSVLLGLIMLAKAWGYYLGRFDLLNSTRGVVQGASYTDVNAQLPALNFLMIAALICAVLFLVNIKVRLWSLPVIALALLALVSVLLGTAYPAFVQKFRVEPQEFQREQPYIIDNIEGTRTAFGITDDEVKIPPTRPYQPQVTATDLRENETTIRNIRLWRPSILAENFQSLQRIRQYYEFRDVDVDRYTLEGERTVLMVAGREVSQAGIQAEARTWQNEHLVYTHGYGAVSSRVNTATTEGAPQLTLLDIPQRIVPGPDLTQPRIYFGEGDVGDTPFVVVGTGTPELDYDGAPPGYKYSGTGGIPMGNVLQRALFAWRFRDVNLLISGQISASSRIMIYRDLAARVPRPVPFLSFDRDPYLSIAEGRLVWIWDAYTSSNQYPYSQSVNLGTATDGQLPSADINYMRNSVKVAVDAYDGTMTYYADLSDPFIQVWDRAFPGLFVAIEQAEPDLQAHFRYPENLFQVQATQYSNYHVTDPNAFYQKQDRWEVPADPTVAGGGDADPSGLSGPIQAARLRPYYVLMRTPDQTSEQFQLVVPFVPEGRQNMVALMTANSDPGEGYGQLQSLELPDGANVDGPSVVFSRINQDPQFSAERTLLDQGGSQVLFGDFLIIPVNDSFLYVQPVYVRSDQATAVPELKRVVVANGDAVGVGTTLAEALAESVSGQVPEPDGGGGGEPTGGTEQQIAVLLEEALAHFQAAQDALTAGDLATYQAELTLAEDAIQQANLLAAQQAGEAAASPSASASASASASPSP
jgi:uncharacterized membrane protein (UPF0182 family)